MPSCATLEVTLLSCRHPAAAICLALNASGQSAQFLKLSLLFKPGFVVTSVPVHADEGKVAADTKLTP